MAMPAATLAHLAKPLDLRRVYIFPTRHGALLGGLMLLILLGAINYDNALAYLLCFLLGGIFLVAMLHTYRNLAGLALTGARADPVFAGTAAQFTIELTGTPGYSRYQLEFAHIAAPARSWWRAPTTGAIANVSSCSDQTSFALSLAAPKRGRLRLERVRLRSVFPLGILQSWAYLDTTAECLVYPAPRGQLPMPPPTATGAGETGHGPGTDDFADLATYRPGDPLRAIHWPAMAKRDDVLVKRFIGSGSGDVLLRWQDVALLASTETRLSQLVQWALEAEHLGLCYGLELPRIAYPPARGGAHLALVLRALALFEG
jgi:uncharacterized protein (DUF58 family)